MKINENKQDQWLDCMADHLLIHGLGAASLRPLAQAAGTSDRMLIYYYKDKDTLIAAILQRIAMRLTAMMIERGSGGPLPFDACLKRTVAILSDAIFDPYMRMFLAIAAKAAEGENVYRTTGKQLGQLYFEWAKGQLQSADEGRQACEAALLMQRIEGMVFLRAIGLDVVNQLAFSA